MADATELAWAAGFFDGEGTTGLITVHPNRGRAEGYKHLHMKVAQNERSTLDRFAAAVGSGHVNGPYEGQGNSKPYYTWQAGGNEPAWLAMQGLWPHLSQPKRDQFASRFQEVFS